MSRYIDADKAIKEIISERDDGSLDGEYKDGFIDGMSTAAKILDDLSATDVAEVKHGYIKNPMPYGECSECGFLIDIRDNYNYCPNCGSRMDLGGDAE